MWILPLAFFVSCKSNEGQWENKQISFPENIVFTKAGKDTIPFDFGKSKWKFFIYADIIDADNRIGRLNEFSSDKYFLLDEHNRVVLVGNPVSSPQMEKSYWDEIIGKPVK